MTDEDTGGESPGGGGVDPVAPSGSRFTRDVLAYLGARLALAAVLAVVIYGVGHVFARDFPVTVAALFAIVLAFPLGIWLFAPLRKRATASVAAFDARRRRDREQLQARLRGEQPEGP